MSYNGVGLSTARGSGTNGFVQRNMSALKQKTIVRRETTNYLQAPEHQMKAANLEILDHERKRTVEIKCLELEDQLMEQGLGEDDIEERIISLREELLASLESGLQSQIKMKDWQTHQLAEAKERDIKRFGEALGIRSDYKLGSSFSAERHEERKQEALEKRAEYEARKKADFEARTKVREEKQREYSERRLLDRRSRSRSRNRNYTERSCSPRRRKVSYSRSRSRGPTRRSPERKMRSRSKSISSNSSKSRSVSPKRGFSNPRPKSKSPGRLSPPRAKRPSRFSSEIKESRTSPISSESSRTRNQ